MFTFDFLAQDLAKANALEQKKKKEYEEAQQRKKAVELKQKQAQAVIEEIKKQKELEAQAEEKVQSYADLYNKKSRPLLEAAYKFFPQTPIALNNAVISKDKNAAFVDKVTKKTKSFEKKKVYDFAVRKDDPETIYYFIPDDAKAKGLCKPSCGHSSLLTQKEQDEFAKNTPLIVYAGEFETDGDGNIKGWNNQSGHFGPFMQYRTIFGNHWGLTSGNGIEEKANGKIFSATRELISKLIWDDFRFNDYDDYQQQQAGTPVFHNYKTLNRIGDYADANYNNGYKYNNDFMSLEISILAILGAFILCLTCICASFICGAVSAYIGSNIVGNEVNKKHDHLYEEDHQSQV